MIAACLTAMCVGGLVPPTYVPQPRTEQQAIARAADSVVRQGHRTLYARSTTGGSGEGSRNKSSSLDGDTEAPAEHLRRSGGIEQVWLDLAMCESTMRWDYNGDSGLDGGLQYLPATYDAFKPDGFPEYAWQASPVQQVQVGKLVAAEQGAQAWPTCTAELGITTEELL